MKFKLFKNKLILLNSILFIFILNINFILGFNILDSNNEVNYFSNDNNEVYINLNPNLIETNLTNISIINYNISFVYNSSNFIDSRNLSFNNDSGLFEDNFSLNNLMNVYHVSSNFEIFNITIFNNSKIIYFDSEKPKLNNFNYKISLNKLNLNFSFSDNYKIKKVLLYQIVNSDYILIADVTNLSSFEYNIDSVGKKDFIFKIYDYSNNLNEIKESVIIDDIFKPKINSYKIINEDNLFKLNFDISDDNLKEYKIIQNDLVLSSNINCSELSSTINLPFTDGNIIFNVCDQNNNCVNQTISLKSPINIYYGNNDLDNKYYSNTNEFKFESNSDFCYLKKIDSNYLNLNLSKNNNEFKGKLNLSYNGDYLIDFICNYKNYEKEFKHYFIYDTKSPLYSKLNYSLENDGSIKLFWTKSYDNKSNIKYKLYRNSDLIYSGSKLKYDDFKVIYPNNYSYYLYVEDLAGNKIKSNKINNIIPKKVKVDFSTNINDGLFLSKDNFDLKIATEKGDSILVEVFNNNSLIYSKKINNSYFNNDINVNLSKGLNKIHIKVEDNFSNIKDKNFFISYQPIELSTNNDINKRINENISSNKINKKTEINRNSKNSLNSNMNNLLNKSKLINNLNNKNINLNIFTWLILLIIIFILLAYLLGIWDLSFEKIKYLKRNINKSKRINSKLNKNNKLNLDFNFKRRNDSKLGTTLNKIKKNRIKKQKERLEFEKKKNLIKKDFSDYSKKKFEDISKNKKELNLNFKKKNNSKLNYYIFLKNKFNSFNKFILDSGDYLRNKLNNNLNSLNNNLKKEKEKIFQDYLNKVRKSSWNSSKDYLLKTKIEEEKKIREKEKEKLEQEKKEEELELKRIEEIEEKKNKALKKLEELRNKKKKKEEINSDLNNYLLKKSKKKIFYFAEKFVNNDLKNRMKNK